jgi:hypothetical protein
MHEFYDGMGIQFQRDSCPIGFHNLDADGEGDSNLFMGSGRDLLYPRYAVFVSECAARA